MGLHLWLHFTQMAEYENPANLRVIVRGDGARMAVAA